MNPLPVYDHVAELCDFRIERFSGTVQSLLQEKRLLTLDRGQPNTPFEADLHRLQDDLLAGFGRVKDEDAARACIAGLYLYHDFWEEAHHTAQDLATREGSYWHAIIHRREPDAWNSKYWFRRVGDHPVFSRLAAVARQLAGDQPPPSAAEPLCRGDRWDPFAFVDVCEQARHRGNTLETWCWAVQLAEWMWLFTHCYDRAAG